MDYFRLGWDQLSRRKVVTALCALGIAIGSSSIIVALAIGESITHYTRQQMSMYLKTDEIIVYPNRTIDEDGMFRGEITPEKIELIRSLPHVEAVLSHQNIGYFSYVVDGTKRNHVELIAIDFEHMEKFGYELQQGSFQDAEQTIVLNYGATLDLFDERIFQVDVDTMIDFDIVVSYPLYQKILTLESNMGEGSSNNQLFQLRVAGILKKAEHLPDERQRYPKEAYISHETWKTIQQNYYRTSNFGMWEQEANLRVKVDDPANIEQVEQWIHLLDLSPMNNLYQQEQLESEFVIVRLIFGGVGMFVLLVASISIIVAMTMSTYQRRRQIGIMKVLGSNLRQIRNMFLVESALLGLLGGLIGILISYWVVWGINAIVIHFSGSPSSSDILFLRLWILPIGLGMAIMTGVVSGIYPAVKASRTDALTAIQRE